MAYSAEVQAVLDRVMNPTKNVPEPIKTARLYSPPIPTPRFDRKKMLALHKAGKRVSEIAEEMGAHRATVARGLDAMGVPVTERRGGPVRREMCPAGLHKMEGNSREVKGGGRMCIPCKANNRKKEQ